MRTWTDRWKPELGGLEDALYVSDPDVVHIQFNFGFFEFGRWRTSSSASSSARGVVMTLHRTLDYRRPR